MNTKDQQVLNFLTKIGMGTIEDCALHFTGESRQNLYTTNFNRLEKLGKIVRTGDQKRTTNGGLANIYKVNNEKRDTSLFKSEEHDAFVVEVDYDTALHIKTFCMNVANRNVHNQSKSIIEIKEAMLAGNFTPNSMLQFDKDGILIDGHHRITAQVETKTDQTYVVQVGCDFYWVDSVDIGKKRSTKDAVHMKFFGDCSQQEEKLISAIATHFHCNLNKPSGVDITGAGISNVELGVFIQEFGKDKLIDLANKIEKLSKDLPDFKEAINSRCPVRRAVVATVAEIINVDEDFGSDFIHAVFGRNSDGVFRGTTPVAVKQIFNEVCNKMSNKTIQRGLAEKRVYTAFVNAHNLLKKIHNGQTTTESYINLNSNSKYLVKQEGSLITNTVRAI